jgi:hypothetical protein
VQEAAPPCSTCVPGGKKTKYNELGFFAGRVPAAISACSIFWIAASGTFVPGSDVLSVNEPVRAPCPMAFPSALYSPS